jgi:Kef-type K+ transport system membrane component KefB
VTLGAAQVAQLLTTITVVLLCAHAVAALFSRLRQPPVIGEITAGLLLGPTLLGLLAAPVAAALLPTTGPTAIALGALAQLGLLLLMFVTGGELRTGSPGRAGRTVGAVASTGLVAPFVAGALIALALDHGRFSGPAGTPVTFALVFSIAVAVTSIPVISRIMLDLGILHTGFARIVLSVAVLEDIVLYGVLAVVLSLAHTATGEDYGLWALLGVESTAWATAYHLVVTVVFFSLFLGPGRRLIGWALHSRANLVERRSPVASRLAVLLGAVLICVLLGINPIFGALLAGVAVRRSDPSAPSTDAPPDHEPAANQRARHAWETIRQFSLAYFIPIYFVTVGLKLDLIRNFEPGFFLWFLAVCCVVKAASIWAGARLAGQPGRRAVDLAVALNARGGPGIVLATVTLDAGIINDSFFTSIVLLSMVTSQLAGVWLDHRRPAVTTEDDAGGAVAEMSTKPPAGGHERGGDASSVRTQQFD